MTIASSKTNPSFEKFKKLWYNIYTRWRKTPLLSKKPAAGVVRTPCVPLAQSVEHLTFNQGVRGSSPRWHTNMTAKSVPVRGAVATVLYQENTECWQKDPFLENFKKLWYNKYVRLKENNLKNSPSMPVLALMCARDGKTSMGAAKLILNPRLETRPSR